MDAIVSTHAFVFRTSIDIKLLHLMLNLVMMDANVIDTT